MDNKILYYRIGSILTIKGLIFAIIGSMFIPVSIMNIFPSPGYESHVSQYPFLELVGYLYLLFGLGEICLGGYLFYKGMNMTYGQGALHTPIISFKCGTCAMEEIIEILNNEIKKHVDKKIIKDD